MQSVLIIAENSFQQERLCSALKLDRSIQLTTANLRQINPKNLKAFRQSDLIVIEDTSEQEGTRTTEHLLSSLKTTGLPIILLPSWDDRTVSSKEPLVLNLTEQSLSQPGVAALINQIRSQYTVRHDSQPLHNLVETSKFQDPVADEMSAVPIADSAATLASKQSATTPSELSDSKDKSTESNKIAFALTAVGRISKQLREPLSNMNLAIHMLSQVRSLEERDRYIKLLREEYQRELKLVNELENLHANIQDKLQMN